MNPGDPSNEVDRLSSLRSYRILDSLPEEEYDSLTQIAAQICGTPVSLISLVDEKRQWFKSRVGVPAGFQETDRDIAFCAHNILEQNSPLVVPDARKDPRFADNPLVVDDPQVVFYAGVPLVNREGYALGSLCVIDHNPRQLEPAQLSALEALAAQVIKLFELRQALKQAEDHLREREAAYALLRDFSHVIAHDLKAPIRNIRQAGEILLQEYGHEFSGEAGQLLEMVEERAAAASDMVDGVLRYSQASRSLPAERSRVAIADVIRMAQQQIGGETDYDLVLAGEVSEIVTSRVALLQIFQNLIGNACKFSDKARCCIHITTVNDEGFHRFAVQDNGPGIPPDHRTSVFRLFHSAEADNKRGHGVGLSIVKRLVEALGGEIGLESEVGEGTTFVFTLPRHN